jgi:hypothetical protein
MHGQARREKRRRLCLLPSETGALTGFIPCNLAWPISQVLLSSPPRHFISFPITQVPDTYLGQG